MVLRENGSRIVICSPGGLPAGSPSAACMAAPTPAHTILKTMPIRRALPGSADLFTFCARITLGTFLRIARGCFAITLGVYTGMVSAASAQVSRLSPGNRRRNCGRHAKRHSLSRHYAVLASVLPPVEGRYHPISNCYARLSGAGLRICELPRASFAHCEIRIQALPGTASVVRRLAREIGARDAGVSSITKRLRVPVASAPALMPRTRSVSVQLPSHGHGKVATPHVMHIADTRDGGTVPENG